MPGPMLLNYFFFMNGSAMHALHAWVIHAYDDTVVGLITENNESVCWEEVKYLVACGVKKSSPLKSGKLRRIVEEDW